MTARVPPYAAGVDKRFDDLAGGAESLVRQVLRGHTFDATDSLGSSLDGRDTIHQAGFYRVNMIGRSLRPDELDAAGWPAFW